MSSKGYSVVCGKWGVEVLEKIRLNTCVQLDVRSDGKEGFFIVCNSQVIKGAWGGEEGENAWNLMLKEVEKCEKPFHIFFEKPPEDAIPEEQMEITALDHVESSVKTFSGLSAGQIGKRIMAVLTKLQHLGYRPYELEVICEEGKTLLVKVGGLSADGLRELRILLRKEFEDLGITSVVVIE